MSRRVRSPFTGRRVLAPAVLCMCLASCPAVAQEASTGTFRGPAVSTGTAADVDELNAAVGELNYKLELLQGRHLGLEQETAELRDDLGNLKEVVDRITAAPSADIERRLDDVEARLSLVRSEIAALREDASLEGRGADRSRGTSERREWLRSNWLGLSSLILSLAALAVAL